MASVRSGTRAHADEWRIHRSLNEDSPSIGRLSASASLHHSLCSADFITNIGGSIFGTASKLIEPQSTKCSSRDTANRDRTDWLGRQDSKHCIPNDRHQTRALPQKG
jgi:hypothetical protein